MSKANGYGGPTKVMDMPEALRGPLLSAAVTGLKTVNEIVNRLPSELWQCAAEFMRDSAVAFAFCHPTEDTTVATQAPIWAAEALEKMAVLARWMEETKGRFTAGGEALARILEDTDGTHTGG